MQGERCIANFNTVTFHHKCTPERGYVGVYSLPKSRFFKETFYLKMGGCELETGFQLDGNRFPVFSELHFSRNRFPVRRFFVWRESESRGIVVLAPSWNPGARRVHL